MYSRSFAAGTFFSVQPVIVVASDLFCIQAVKALLTDNNVINSGCRKSIANIIDDVSDISALFFIVLLGPEQISYSVVRDRCAAPVNQISKDLL